MSTPPPPAGAEDPAKGSEGDYTKPKPSTTSKAQQAADLGTAAREAVGNVGQPPGGAGSTSNPWLFIGNGQGREKPFAVGTIRAAGEIPSEPGKGDFLPLTEMQNLFWNFRPEDKAALDGYIAKKGGDAAKMSSLEKWKVWTNIVETAAQYQNAGKNFSPWAVMFLEMYDAEQTKKKSLAGTTTATSTAVDLSTRDGAKAILWQASRTLLGRAPTDDEVDRFFGSVNQLERANPSVTTTTTTTDEEGRVVSQDSTRTGGVEEGARAVIAQEGAMANPEYGAYQAATTYYDALMQAIKG